MRLRRADPDSAGIRRLRRGCGFQYVDASGESVTDPEVVGRIKDLVIPPAWRKVWICPENNGHIQAVGVDNAGRKQYLYHTEWRRSRDEEKHDRVLTLARRLPNLRAAVQSDLDGRGASKDRVLAAALRILDLGVFRTGGEEYAEENGTHGLAILLREHVTVRDSALVFCYPARGGIERNVRICDEDLLRAVKTMRRAAGATDRLLACRNDGTWHEVRSAEINERFKEFAGEEFTAKDLRTWNATVLAAMAPRTPHSRRASGAANARRPP